MKHSLELSLCAAVAYFAFACPHTVRAQNNSTAEPGYSNHSTGNPGAHTTQPGQNGTRNTQTQNPGGQNAHPANPYTQNTNPGTSTAAPNTGTANPNAANPSPAQPNTNPGSNPAMGSPGAANPGGGNPGAAGAAAPPAGGAAGAGGAAPPMRGPAAPGNNAQAANGSSQWSHPNGRSAGNSARTKAEQKEARKMVPAQASLSQSIDAKNAHKGEMVKAKLTGTVQLKNGAKLPSGTVLEGKVTRDHLQPDNVRLAVCFNKAKMKDGKTVPVKAIVVAVNPPSMQTPMAGGSKNGALAAVWTPKMLKVQQINAVSGATMYSNLASRNSAVFVSRKKDDVKIDSGTQLAMAIAPSHANNHANNQSRQGAPTM